MHFQTILVAIGLSAFANGLPAQSLYVQRSLSQDVISCSGAFPGQSGGVSQFDAWTDEVVSRHNTARAQYGAPAVSWNAALYAGTLLWAQQCVFTHSPGGAYGENLAAGAGGGYGFATGLQSWMAESSSYDYNNPGFSSTTGHFTQVVWKSTTGVACAMTDCPAGTIFPDVASKFIVCRYTPPGNVQGQFPNNVGRPV